MAGADAAADLPSKIITGADAFGASLKDAMIIGPLKHHEAQSRCLSISHLRSLGIDVEDTAGAEVGRRISASSSSKIRGLVCCGTGVGVAMFANKFPGVYAATCLTVEDAVNARSISNSNVLALSGIKTSPETAVEIFDAWIKTPFKSPCPASESKPWSSEISSFLDNSLSEMLQIGKPTTDSTTKQTDQKSSSCAICCLAKNREFTPVEIMPGGSMKIVRETPTSAIVRFKAGSVEPAHHHTFGHDLIVIKGKKSVWNLSKKERADLVDGDYLFTPACDVHRVKYHEDTEFFITWDGHWDIFLDEDLVTAKKAIEEEAS